MKRKILYGMIALLGASLLFLACDTGTGGDNTDTSSLYDPETGSTTPTQAAQAQALADKLGKGTVATGSNVLIPASSTGTDAPKIESTETYTVPTGINLVIEGELEVEGTINNNGTIEVTGGTYTLNAGASGTNNGTVIVKNGATVKSGGTIGGTGTNVVEAGGTVYFNDDGSGTAFIGSSGTFRPGTNATFSYNNTEFVVAGGEVTFAGTVADLIDAEAQQLKVKADGKLKIGSSATLRLKNSTQAKPTVVGVPGAMIEIVSGGSITIDAGDFVNFYATGGSTATETPVAGKTYEWKDDAGGTGNPGWKATT